MRFRWQPITALIVSLSSAASVSALAGPAETSPHDPVVTERPDEPRHPRRGFLIGLNAGVGGTAVAFTLDPIEVEQSRPATLFGGYRLGYAVSHSIALTIEGRTAYGDDSQGDWQLYGTFLTLTWWPDACGFFLRAGGGGGKIESVHTIGQTAFRIEESIDLLAVGLGYEWRVSRHFALGVAIDVFAGEIEIIDDLVDLGAGNGSISIQFNWYL
jgi:hypothetical protein